MRHGLQRKYVPTTVLRKSYGNPTKILRQCGLLHCSVELKEIWAIECLAQALKEWELGEPSFLFLPPPSSLLPPTSSFLLRPSSFPFLLPPSSFLLPPASCLLPPGSLKTSQIGPELPEAHFPYENPTTILRKSYDRVWAPSSDFRGGAGRGWGREGGRG